MSKPERYTPKEAEEEATKLEELVKSGKAIDYEDAKEILEMRKENEEATRANIENKLKEIVEKGEVKSYEEAKKLVEEVKIENPLEVITSGEEELRNIYEEAKKDLKTDVAINKIVLEGGYSGDTAFRIKAIRDADKETSEKAIEKLRESKNARAVEKLGYLAVFSNQENVREKAIDAMVELREKIEEGGRLLKYYEVNTIKYSGRPGDESYEPEIRKRAVYALEKIRDVTSLGYIANGSGYEETKKLAYEATDRAIDGLFESKNLTGLERLYSIPKTLQPKVKEKIEQIKEEK